MTLPENSPRLLSALNPVLAYSLGTGMLLLGLYCFLRPRQEYRRFGLPLEHAQPDTKTRRHSPLIFLKGTRETTYGLALILLQYQGNVNAVTTMAAVISLAGLADGLVVWLNGGQELRHKTFGHWFASVVLGCWAAWRAHQGWENPEERQWPEGPIHIWST
ncbi:hypothetical protein UCDDA912_g04483 [Diaporthe ampelina]|uniref:Integral membrane protein n=1 Tax=Diaporthe ampelina TaxID=1214573 RepID=A0A0G2FMD9_9PEZI|nr:hypothetical protein UCDDA912_g04483 [Diaporthe ampelina]